MGPPGIRFVSGANATDTAGADLLDPLLIEVRDAARRLAPFRTLVHFTVLPGQPGRSPSVYVEGLTSGYPDVTASGELDASGRTAVLIHLGEVAGEGRIEVSVPTLGLADTTAFTAVPAAPSRVVIGPSDTTVVVGRTATFRATVTDRFGNARSEGVSWSMIGSGAAVSNAGTVTTLTPGVFRVVAATALGRDTSIIRAVPSLELVAWHVGRDSIATMSIDGSNVRGLARVEQSNEPGPVWIPGSNRVVFSTYREPFLRLQTVDENRTVRTLFDPLPPGMGHQTAPVPTADGRWLYFVAFNTACQFDAFCLHRVHLDGSGLEPLLVDGMGIAATQVGPSPDGSKVAVVLPDGIRVLDVATRTLSTWAVPGRWPRWSPDGTRIVVVDAAGFGPLSLLMPDGSALDTLTDPSLPFHGQPASWSPDGTWIIGSTDDGLALVHVVSRMMILLPYHGFNVQTPSLRD